MLSGLFRGASTRGARLLSSSKNFDKNLDTMLMNNRAWVAKKNKAEPEFFKTLGKGQSPEFLYIGCSDSRVVASEMLGVELGQLFVARNVANLVVSSDMNFASVLTYAVEHLKVKHILVTGHYDCGGVRASMANGDLGILNGWLQNIRDIYRLHRVELDAIEDLEARHRRLVEINVVEQCLNLYKTNVVQKKRIETSSNDDEAVSYPRIHGLVFDPGEGILRKLDVNFKKHIGELSSIYDLFENDKDDQGHYMLKKDQGP